MIFLVCVSTWQVEHLSPRILENEGDVCVELQNKEKKITLAREPKHECVGVKDDTISWPYFHWLCSKTTHLQFLVYMIGQHPAELL